MYISVVVETWKSETETKAFETETSTSETETKPSETKTFVDRDRDPDQAYNVYTYKSVETDFLCAMLKRETEASPPKTETSPSGDQVSRPTSLLYDQQTSCSVVSMGNPSMVWSESIRLYCLSYLDSC